MRPTLRFSFLLIVYIFIFSSAHADNSIWVSVDTTKLRLEIKRGNKTLVTMENIAIGQNGAGIKTHKGDDITPIGSYKIGWINNKSRFYKFYGFTYPSIQNASTALLNVDLSEKEYNKIILAHKKKKIPPQNTILGGQIGIHGLGAGDKEIHKFFNWTHGCIALTNKQIDQLARWVGKGTVVKVE